MRFRPNLAVMVALATAAAPAPKRRYAIAYTKNGGHPASEPIVGWRQSNGADEVFDNYAEALRANENDGWRGYVREYPSGEKHPDAPW